jgi:hypothetical protein
MCADKNAKGILSSSYWFFRATLSAAFFVMAPDVVAVRGAKQRMVHIRSDVRVLLVKLQADTSAMCSGEQGCVARFLI